MKTTLRYISALLILCITFIHAETTWTTGEYDNNQNLKQTLTVANAEKRIVTLKGETEAWRDIVWFTDENGATLPVTLKSGTTSKWLSGVFDEIFTVEGSSITANLRTGESVTKSGITVTVKSKSKSVEETTPTPIATWTTGAYDNNQNLKQTLTVPNAEKITVTLKGETEAWKDIVWFTDENGDTIPVTLKSGKTGKWLSGVFDETFTVEGSSIIANFKSGASVTKSGITVTVRSTRNSYMHKKVVDINQGLGNINVHIADDTRTPIWIIGDSTVATWGSKYKERGWGQVIGSILKNGDRVDNRARSGASSKSYEPVVTGYSTNTFWGDGITPNSWGGNSNYTATPPQYGLKKDIVDTDTTKGGYLFIQFGHNDSYKHSYVESVDTVPGLGNEMDTYIMKYITHAKENNVIPILVTPMARMHANSSFLSVYHKSNSLALNTPTPYEALRGQTGDWGQTIRDIGERENIIVLDLLTKSKEYFDTFANSQAIKNLYSHDQSDQTHFNQVGAELMAVFIRDLACDVINGGDAALCSQFIGH